MNTELEESRLELSSKCEKYTKIKIINVEDKKDYINLENTINEFIKDRILIDIKLEINSGYAYNRSCIIIYREK